MYERYVTTPWPWRYGTDALEPGHAFGRLAEHHDAAGEPTRAAAMRRRLLQSWRRAGPELRPLVDAARATLAGATR